MGVADESLGFMPGIRVAVAVDLSEVRGIQGVLLGTDRVGL